MTPAPSADPAARPRVFGIGLNKTGTISLHEALTLLGYRSLHWGGPDVRRTVERAAADQRPLVEDFPDHDAFSDILALSERFALLDEQYPGSHFILTTRPLEDWIESRRAHVARNRERAARGEYSGTFLVEEPDRWRAEMTSHEARVAAYFEGRDDLLTLRVTEGDGFDVLCPFLGRPEPGVGFPWRHRASSEG